MHGSASGLLTITLLGNSANTPPADVPEAARWHHVHDVDPVQRRELARGRRKLQCQPKRTKLSSVATSRRRGSSATWPLWTSSWLPTTSSTKSLMGDCRAATA